VPKELPPGFNADEIRRGLLQAMEFGAPTRTEDQATFYFVARSAPTGPADDEGVPFDPSERPTNEASPDKLTVPCAVEYYDATGVIETFGVITPTKIRVTLQDPEWQQVKDFAYVVAGGDKYIRARVEPPVALGSLDFWMVWCRAEDER
jgi:hypothetical protein